MLPHGPRPTTMPRSSSDVNRIPKPMAVSDDGGPTEWGGGAGEVRARRDGRRAAVRERPGHDAGPGRLRDSGRRDASDRRPFASMTAWPTWAANPRAIAIAADREEELRDLRHVSLRDAWWVGSVASARLVGSGDGRAARWRPVGRDDERSRLDPQDEAAVSAGFDARLADELALRAAERERRLVAVARGRPERRR